MDDERVKERFAKGMLAFTSERFAVEAVYGILTRFTVTRLQPLLLQVLTGNERLEEGLTIRRHGVYDDQVVTLEVCGSGWVLWLEPSFREQLSETDILNCITLLQKYHSTERERILCIMGRCDHMSDRLGKSVSEVYQPTVPVMVRYVLWDRILALLLKA